MAPDKYHLKNKYHLKGTKKSFWNIQNVLEYYMYEIYMNKETYEEDFSYWLSDGSPTYDMGKLYRMHLKMGNYEIREIEKARHYFNQERIRHFIDSFYWWFEENIEEI